MREQNMMAAANQYATRPADERFATVQDMIDAALYDKNHSVAKTINLRDMQAVAHIPYSSGTPQGIAPELMLETARGRATLTHWSFGQLARTIGAPASYLRTLPPELAARNINHGLHAAPVGTTANMLLRANGGTPAVRACTSETYGRVWDAPLYDAVRTQIMQDDKWTTPPTWTGEPAGAYRGDRDSFLILVNGGSIVTDPTLRNSPTPMIQGASSVGGTRIAPSGNAGPTDGMFRGIIIRNSEVGAAAIWITRILFRYICGNHIIWSAITDSQFRRRHVGTKVERDTIREISKTAWEWSNASATRDEAIIRTLVETELATTKDAVIDELRKIGASKEQATAAYNLCEQKESASPRSFWGLAQGLTRASQDSGYQDERLTLDQLAGQLLAVGAKRAAVRV